MLSESAAKGHRLFSSSHEMPEAHRGAFPSSFELLGRGWGWGWGDSLNGLGCTSSAGKDAVAFLLFRQNTDFNSVENAAAKEAGEHCGCELGLWDRQT